jgi:hypothetical protein
VDSSRAVGANSPFAHGRREQVNIDTNEIVVGVHEADFRPTNLAGRKNAVEGRALPRPLQCYFCDELFA